MNAQEHSAVLEAALGAKAIAILRGVAPADVAAAVNALYEGGIRLAEITFDQSGEAGIARSQECIRLVAEHCAVIPGAGTVMTPGQVELAAEAGAKYIISPNVDEAVIRRTRELGLVSIPGAFTPTEIAAAYACGADIVKVFPAGLLGPDYIKAVRGPMKHVPLMAVGGVDASNARAFLDAGCVGVGCGGKLVDLKAIAAGNFSAMTEAARALIAAISD